jgi:hypothetical protein
MFMGHIFRYALLLLNIFRTNLYFRVLIMSEKGDVPADKEPKGKKK